MNYRMPLRYKISSWTQLPQCKSNNNADLKLTVSEIHSDRILTGLKISVVHPKVGTLFSEVLGASGSMITYLNEGSLSYELSTQQILEELNKYGFIIEYNPRTHLPESMIKYLATLNELKFDKLRKLSVYNHISNSEPQYKWYIVGFKSKQNPYWLNINYSAPLSQFEAALVEGSAVNISEFCASLGFDWNWLDFVANIKDILDENRQEGDADGC